MVQNDSSIFNTFLLFSAFCQLKNFFRPSFGHFISVASITGMVKVRYVYVPGSLSDIYMRTTYIQIVLWENGPSAHPTTYLCMKVPYFYWFDRKKYFEKNIVYLHFKKWDSAAIPFPISTVWVHLLGCTVLSKGVRDHLQRNNLKIGFY